MLALPRQRRALTQVQRLSFDHGHWAPGCVAFAAGEGVPEVVSEQGQGILLRQPSQAV